MHTVVVWKMFGDMAVTLVRKAVNEFNFCTTNYSGFHTVLKYDEKCFVLVMKS